MQGIEGSPLITAIIPTYRRPQKLRRAIKSVMNQTYKNIEILVVDDCSKDNTNLYIKIRYTHFTLN